MSDAPCLDRSLEAAEEVLDVVRQHGADAILIGALALAVHGFPRDTTDLDLAVAVHPDVLRRIAADLAARGYLVAFREPAADDPLGGVVDVRTRRGDLVQLVNFLNPPSRGFPVLVRDAIETATALRPDGLLRVVDLEHLIVFKLYAGGPKSALDILALIQANPGLDLDRLMAICRGYRLDRALDRVLRLDV
ncbi:hypothetical protein KBD49_10210 [Myxococcota bacterium]|jgi:hypothetical protein|nr:hypothetical protein [Myxococcota bacterium]